MHRAYSNAIQRHRDIRNVFLSVCHRKPCNGILIDCIWLDHTKACELNEHSDRRFLWKRFVATNTSHLHCPGEIVGLFYLKVNRVTTCNTCSCICAEQEGNSTAMRTISLIPQLADIHRNMQVVMTGVRFTEKDRMFHLQIEQAELGPFGKIVPGTAEWKVLRDFQYDPAGEGSFSMKKGEEFVELTEFVDFSFVAFTQRTINLDELFANHGQVLIGARFFYNDVDDAFELQIKSWPVDLKTGELADGNLSDNKWIGWKNSQMRSENYDRPGRKFEIGETDETLRTDKLNEPCSVPNQKLRIRATGIDIDLSQHTVPYLDLQPVTYSTAKIPLNGLEIIYKGVEGFGGFLGFRIFAFDFTEDFRWKMPISYYNKYRPYFHENLILQDSFK